VASSTILRFSFETPSAKGFAVGLFAEAPFAGGEALPKVGLLFGGGWEPLFVQGLGASVVAAFSAVVCYAVMKALDAKMGLRVSQIVEVDGADTHEHGYAAYLGTELPATFAPSAPMTELKLESAPGHA